MKSAVIAMLLLAGSVNSPQSRSFAGEIMDRPCAAMGTHDRMMKGVDAKMLRSAPRSALGWDLGTYSMIGPPRRHIRSRW